MIFVQTSVRESLNPCRSPRSSHEPAAARTLFHHPALARIESELDGLSARLTQCVALQRDPAGLHPGVDGPGVLGKLRIHLFLTASRLLPMWRDLCDDARDVDRTEVQLGQLRALLNHALQAGPEAPLAEAYVAVLADELRRQQQRTVVLLRAMQAVVASDRLHALGVQWASEREQMLGASAEAIAAAVAQGQPADALPAVDFDNEDADPVGARDLASN